MRHGNFTGYTGANPLIWLLALERQGFDALHFRCQVNPPGTNDSAQGVPTPMPRSGKVNGGIAVTLLLPATLRAPDLPLASAGAVSASMPPALSGCQGQLPGTTHQCKASPPPCPAQAGVTVGIAVALSPLHRCAL